MADRTAARSASHRRQLGCCLCILLVGSKGGAKVRLSIVSAAQN